MPNYVSKIKPNGMGGTEYTIKDAELREVVQNIQTNKADKSDVTETDTPNSTPFLYRETPYEADRVFLDALVGASVVVNQLVENGNFADSSGWTGSNATLSISDGKAVLSNPTNDSAALKRNLQELIQENHVYLQIVTITSNTNLPRVRFGYSGDNISSAYSKYWSVEENKKTECKNLMKANASATTNTFYVYPFLTKTVQSTHSVDIENVQVIDLTKEFGTEIADYAYNLANNGGIAWLKSHGFFTKDYYPYNTGELISVKTSGKKYVGFNVWDEEWESGYINLDTGENQSDSSKIRAKNYIRVLPNTTYYKKSLYPFWNCYYDENKNFIGYGNATVNATFTTPANCHYIRFAFETAYGTTYMHDTCINLSKTEGTPKNGDYVPYEEHTYDISNIDLRGIPKLVNNELVYDGDTYESNGDVTRKYGIVDLGDLTWGKNDTTTGHWRFVASLSSAKINTGGDTVPNIISEKYVTGTPNDVWYARFSCITINNGNNNILVCDESYSDATTFKTAMSGVYLIYELATPTAETADPYTNPQICDKDGTEEFIDDRTVPIPVGHNSRYADLPSMMDGDYLSYMAKNFASEDYVDRAVEKVTPKAKLVGFYEIYDESGTLYDVTIPTNTDANFILFEYHIQSRANTTLIRANSSYDKYISVVINNGGDQNWVEVFYDSILHTLTYTSNITTGFGVLYIYSI